MIGVQIACTAAVLLAVASSLGQAADMRCWYKARSAAEWACRVCYCGVASGLIITIWSL